MPETKPDLQIFEDGECDACKSFKNRKKINWNNRKKELIKIIKKFKNNNYYDCIVPVSGGKDSTYQTLTALELGMKPLCVVATTDMLSDIGRKNIENLKKLGVDCIEYSSDPVIRRKINLFTLETVGDISWAEHITIFTIPVRISVNMKIPLILWGENSQNENGGPGYMRNKNILDRKWLEEFGGLLALRTSDISEIMNIPKKQLMPYSYPSDFELKKSKTTGIFLGHYLPWDGYENFKLAEKNGFQVYHKKEVEGNLVNYENLDNLQMRIHDYFKFLKYGYDRVTDWCCWHIRRGRMTRDESIQIAKAKGGKFPRTYLGVDLKEILKEINCTEEKFLNICNKFTNTQIFKCNNKGLPILDKEFNLTKINYDNIVE